MTSKGGGPKRPILLYPYQTHVNKMAEEKPAVMPSIVGLSRYESETYMPVNNSEIANSDE